MSPRLLGPALLLVLAVIPAMAAPATEQRLGPFALGPATLTVVLHLKTSSPAGSQGGEEPALEALEIHDGSGAVLHRETFADSDSCMASAQPLKGGAGSGLLIGIGCLPSAPGSGDVWEIFGFQNGKLVRFGKPFTAAGEFLEIIPTPPRRLGSATLFQPDVMRFKVWAGNFQATVLLSVDWMQGRLGPGQRCYEQTGRGLRESGCEVPVTAERVPLDEELTFVRLFTEAREDAGPARHVVIKKDSLVEILAARVRLTWDDRAETIVFGVDEADPWLKVRIDGKEGWIHTQEDFIALGLPQAG